MRLLPLKPHLYQVTVSAPAAVDEDLAMMKVSEKVTGWALNSWQIETMTGPSFDLECRVHEPGLHLPHLWDRWVLGFPSTLLVRAVPTTAA